MEKINFSIHDTVLISIIFAVVNREEDDSIVADFTFEDTCLKDEIKTTEMNLFAQACDCARVKNFNFEYDVITLIRSVHSL